jgi:hypothetical protein
VYVGQIDVPDNNGNGTGTIAFAENFDDSVLVKIDGVQRLKNGTHNVATTTGALTLPAGLPRSWASPPRPPDSMYSPTAN